MDVHDISSWALFSGMVCLEPINYDVMSCDLGRRHDGRHHMIPNPSL